MAKYRKKPVIVEAEKYKLGIEDGFDCSYEGISHGDCLGESCENWEKNGKEDCPYRQPYINTLEGKLYISEGDYVITGVKGERYPCKPDVFEMTYEPVEEGGGTNVDELAQTLELVTEKLIDIASKYGLEDEVDYIVVKAEEVLEKAKDYS